MTLKSLIRTAALAASLFVPVSLHAESEAYVEYSSDTETLTFRYDDQKASSTATDVYSIPTDATSTSAPDWNEVKEDVTKVVFDSSFADYRPVSCCRWFSEMYGLTTIEGMEYLNTSEVVSMYEMFEECSSLTSIDLSHFDTSKVTMMGSMFQDCTGLTSIDLSSFDTSNVANMMAMFAFCTSLGNVDLTSFNTSVVTKMGYMFYGDKALSGIYVGDSFTVSDDCTGESMFYDCTSLPGFDASKIDITMANATDGYFLKVNPGSEAWAEYDDTTKTLTFRCSSDRASSTATATFLIDNDDNYEPTWLINYGNTIEKVVIERSFSYFKPESCMDWFFNMEKLATIEGFEYINTSAATDLRNMVAYNPLLTSVNTSGMNTSAAIYMSGMFAGNSKLTELDLASFNTANVTSMDNMFYGCESLETIYASANFTVSDACTGDNMFYGCTKLKNFDSSKVGKEMAKIANGYFTGKTAMWVEYQNSTKTMTFHYDGLKEATEATAKYDIEDHEPEIYPTWRYGEYNDSIQTIVFDPSFANARPQTLHYWFASIYNLSKIEGIEYLNTSEAVNMAYCFAFVRNLKSIDLSHFNTSKVTDMSHMFYDCSALTSADLSSFDMSEVTDVISLFNGCTSLAEVTMFDSSNSKFTSTERIFGNCSSLKTLDISKFDTSNVTTMAEMFYGCAGLTEFDLSVLNTSKVTDMEKMFGMCGGLTKFSFKNADFQNVSTMSQMLWRCNSLEEVEVNPSNTSSLVDMSYIFYQCENLKSVKISNIDLPNVTRMLGVCWDCTKLEKFELTDANLPSLTSITTIFKNCSSLTTIDFKGTSAPKLSDISFLTNGCSSLKEIDLSWLDLSGVTNARNMCYDTPALEKIYVGENFKLLNEDNGLNMFSGCSKLKNYDADNVSGSMANYTTGYLTLRRHFSIGDTSYNVDDTDAVYDADVAFTEGDDFVSDCDFTLAADKTATYEHTNATGWSVVCVPFAFSTESNAAADFYTISSVGESSVSLSLLSGTVAAGTPVIAFSRSNSYTITSAAEAGIVKTPVDTDNLKGTFTAKSVDAGNYVLYNDKFQLASVVPQRTASGQLSPYSAYLTSDVAKDATLTINAEQTSGINTVEASDLLQLLDGAEFYDLQGRRLAEPPVKGIVIVKKGNETRKLIFE